MELPVTAQAWTFFLAAILGFGLSLCYDFFRGLRRLKPWLTWFWDLLFGLLFVGSLLAFLLYPGGGDFRLYNFPGMLLGSCLWFLLCSSLFLRVWMWISVGFRKILVFILLPLTIILKKHGNLQKRSFQLRKNGLE